MAKHCAGQTLEDMVRFTEAGFHILHRELAPFIERPRDNDAEFAMLGVQSQRKHERARLSTEDRLLLYLLRMSESGVFNFLAASSGWSPESCRVDFAHITRCVVEHLNYEIQWPSPEQRARLHGSFEFNPNVIGTVYTVYIFLECDMRTAVIDCTPQFVNRPHDRTAAANLFRKDKDDYFWLHQVVVDHRGEIWSHAYVPGGNTNDRGLFNATILPNRNTLLASSELLLADKGYRGAGPLLICGDADDGEEWEALRSVIENLNASIKNHFPLVHSRWAGGVEEAPLVFRAGLLLTNRINRWENSFPRRHPKFPPP